MKKNSNTTTGPINASSPYRKDGFVDGLHGSGRHGLRPVTRDDDGMSPFNLSEDLVFSESDSIVADFLSSRKGSEDNIAAGATDDGDKNNDDDDDDDEEQRKQKASAELELLMHQVKFYPDKEKNNNKAQEQEMEIESEDEMEYGSNTVGDDMSTSSPSQRTSSPPPPTPPSLIMSPYMNTAHDSRPGLLATSIESGASKNEKQINRAGAFLEVEEAPGTNCGPAGISAAELEEVLEVDFSSLFSDDYGEDADPSSRNKIEEEDSQEVNSSISKNDNDNNNEDPGGAILSSTMPSPLFNDEKIREDEDGMEGDAALFTFGRWWLGTEVGDLFDHRYNNDEEEEVSLPPTLPPPPVSLPSTPIVSPQLSSSPKELHSPQLHWKTDNDGSVLEEAPSAEDVFAAPIVLPRENDILCGRGKRCNMHPGNKKYLAKVSHRSVAYWGSSMTQQQRQEIVEGVMAELEADGIRFLKLVSGPRGGGQKKSSCDSANYVALSRSEARKKIQQCFRTTKCRRNRKNSRKKEEARTFRDALDTDLDRVQEHLHGSSSSIGTTIVGV
mmetsp:Transcript_27425/g.76913  ORF Transcript_27425/g.76913 Transcript_27425/m.76913 type:complete len:556 (-) Transcript_27425:144-1811(-)|eukprot:CAMPEP_0119556058 /NCGR_PEP_ID=MMETSP1352-20130426/8108_1 /TAXON_ID=265584 /ORGANISM="Stauroneis constricta, Strain CCMP1120" /LENGTH=555 /DNA_ID=CAMNT_0007602949 /DNA_START=90 /DNA_END=1757 /DNA_ORIENTATION=-